MREIKPNRQREKLTEIYKAQGVIPIETFFELIGQVDGISILQRVDLESVLFYNCHHYVFDIGMGEEWCKVGESIPKSLDHDTVRFLRNKGFEMIEKPQDGDVVAYRKRWPHSYYGRKYYTNHWGIFEDGRTTSKMGIGHIYRHPLMAIPKSFGNKIAFFRKNHT